MDGWRECARGRYCRTGRRSEDGEVVPGRSPWTYCDPCVADIARALDALPGLYVELGGRLRTRRQGSGERVATTTVHPSAPIDLDTDRLMVNIAALLGSWEERVRVMVGLPPAPVDVSWTRRPAMVARACQTLGEHVPTLIGLPPEPMRRVIKIEDADLLPDDVLGVVRPSYVDAYPDLSGADAGREILWLHRRAEIATGHVNRLVVLDGVACPRCGLMMLTRRVGEDTVSCGACLHRIPRADYEQWTKTLAEGIS